jgi:3-mercaptopyruvate sulfurtransferase SseA
MFIKWRIQNVKKMCLLLLCSIAFRLLAGDVPRTSAISLADLETVTDPIQVVDTRPDTVAPVWPNALHVRAAQVLPANERTPAQFDNTKLAELFRGLDPQAKTLLVGSEKSTENCIDLAIVAYALDRIGFTKIVIATKGVESIPDDAVTKLTIVAANAEKNKLPAPEKPSGAFIDTKEVKDDAIDEEDCQMVDVRTSERYLGSETGEFVKRAGHIPNSRNAPFTIFIEKAAAPISFRFRRPDELKKLLTLLGFAADTSPVPYGDSAREAALGYIAFRLAGFNKARCYEAGMAAWTANPLFQVVTFKWE